MPVPLEVSRRVSLRYRTSIAWFARRAVPAIVGIASPRYTGSGRVLLLAAELRQAASPGRRHVLGGPHARRRALLDDAFMMTAAIVSRSAPHVELDIMLVPVAVPGEAGRLTKVLAGPCAPAVPVSGASEPPARTVGVDRDRQVANCRRSSRRPRPAFDDKDRLKQVHE